MRIEDELPLREEIFAGINFPEFFVGRFAIIDFCELSLTMDFEGINFRKLGLTKDFKGIDFRERNLYKYFEEINLAFTLRNFFHNLGSWF